MLFVAAFALSFVLDLVWAFYSAAIVALGGLNVLLFVRDWRTLVAAGAEVSVRADNNQRPLDLALTKARQSMVDFLEASGATL